MCEYCKIYTDEEIGKIEESGKGYDINRIEAGITTLADKSIDFGILGKFSNWLYLEISERKSRIISQICTDDNPIVTSVEIKYCPFCGRKLDK